ncbi:MAG: hypothetical protein HC920_10875 [Oscillatoriales cyanobacterium SM2_3_0]|nr:hypothetical protein [Oscillatoriales cyanobacterium SM2_3_0]
MMNPSLPKTSAHTLATPAKRLLIKATTNSATNPAKIPCNGTPADLGTNHPSPLHHPECDCDLNLGHLEQSVDTWLSSDRAQNYPVQSQPLTRFPVDTLINFICPTSFPNFGNPTLNS